MNKSKSITVVIRAFNEAEHLGVLLHGLREQSRQVDEIILVDSGSTDATVEIARAGGCRIVGIDKQDFSFGRALNYGCREAQGELILILSAHVFPVYDSYVEQMVSAFDRESVQITYGRQVGDGRTKFSEARVMLQWFPEKNIWDQGHPFSNNANACVRRDAWERHLYDEDLTGLEDLDFANRVLASGGKVAYVADAPVVHVHEETWSVIRNRYRREAIAYSRIVPGSSMGLTAAILLGLKNVVADYWSALKIRGLVGNLGSIFRFRVAQFLGAWEGFRDGGQASSAMLRRFYYPPAASASERAEPGKRIDYVQSPYKS